MTTQSALQYSLPFTHSHTHWYSASMGSSFFSMRGHSGFSIFPKDTSACRWGRLESNCRPSSWRTTALPLRHSRRSHTKDMVEGRLLEENRSRWMLHIHISLIQIVYLKDADHDNILQKPIEQGQMCCGIEWHLRANENYSPSGFFRIIYQPYCCCRNSWTELWDSWNLNF